MSDTVTEFRRKPDEGVIEALEELLTMAREGSMIGFAIMVNQPDGYHFRERGHWSNRDLLMAIELRKRSLLDCFQNE